MSVRRILLVHNSPRVGRYFDRLAESVEGFSFLRHRVGANPFGPQVASDRVDEIVEYGMTRKRARPRYGGGRLAMFERMYRAAARLHYAHVRGLVDRHAPDALGVWGGNSVDAKAVVVAARDAGLPCFQFENGFLPKTTQVDTRGVNVDSSVPRDPEFYERRTSAPVRRLPDAITPRTPRRGGGTEDPIPLPDRYVFVPFQVMLDSQILLHSPWIESMAHLFEVVGRAAAEADGGPVEVVFKEHPSCPERYDGVHALAAERPHVRFANGNSTDELIRNAAGVVTVNSSVGTESLLLERPVLALGNAVYEIPGVAESARSVEALGRWLETVWAGEPPASPLREPFLRFLMDEFLLPDSHQDPGPAHFTAAAARLGEPEPPWVGA